MSTTKFRSFIKKLRSFKKGGESNAKMHLVLTPDVFALRLDAAIFVHDLSVFDRTCKRKTQIPSAKKPTIGFFAQGAISNLQFETAPFILYK